MSNESQKTCIREVIHFKMYVIIFVGSKSVALALSLGWGSLCLDSLLVPQLGVPEIGHRQVVGQAFGTMANLRVCQRVSLWSLILIGYCASAWQRAVSAC